MRAQKHFPLEQRARHSELSVSRLEAPSGVFRRETHRRRRRRRAIKRSGTHACRLHRARDSSARPHDDDDDDDCAAAAAAAATTAYLRGVFTHVAFIIRATFPRRVRASTVGECSPRSATLRREREQASE